MNARRAAARNPESGFILATVLVFIVVLSITAFLSARLTRADIQTVNNLQNEKEALALADAGVHEALYRLSLATNDTATVPTLGSFTASISPQSGPSWNARILLTNAVPSPALTGTAPNQTFSTPSLQLVNQRLAYSNDGSGNAANPTSETLKVEWDICPDATPPGCSNFATDTRRALPLSLPLARRRPVIKITSTGQSGNARRKLVVKAIDCVPGGAGGNGSLTSLNQGCGGGNSVSLNGGNTITASGNVNINAGATSNPPSSCTAAQTGGAQSNITSTGGTVNTVGDTSGNILPAAREGSLPVSDPHADLPPPCFDTISDPSCVNTLRNGTAGAPAVYPVNTAGATIYPGVYYGGIDIRANNVHMETGIYVIAGGGLTVENNASVSSNTGGVMIFNTRVPGATSGPGAAGSLALLNGNTAPSFTSINSGTYEGVVFYQDRNIPAVQPPLSIQGGGVTRVLDGLIYAPNASLTVQGSNLLTIGGSIVVASVSMGGNSSLKIEAPANPGPNEECGGLAYQPITWQDF